MKRQGHLFISRHKCKFETLLNIFKHTFPSPVIRIFLEREHCNNYFQIATLGVATNPLKHQTSNCRQLTD